MADIGGRGRPRGPAAVAAAILAAALLPTGALAVSHPVRAVQVPLAAYPVAAPQPVGDSRLPSLVDDDERLRLRLDPAGGVVGMVDDLRVKIAGSGDFNIVLPGTALAVANEGGDEVPALSDGHLTFQGFLTPDGKKQLNAAATLDPKTYAASLPVGESISYARGGLAVKPDAEAGHAGSYQVGIEVDNLTPQPVTLSLGQASAAQLAPVLEALRSIPDVYTPETDLGSTFPVPASLALTGPVVPLQQQALVPMRVTTTVRLPAGTRVTDSGGATVTTDARGSVLVWTYNLPAEVGGGGARRLHIGFHTSSFRVPGVETVVDVVPLPGRLFAPPGGGTWRDWLAGRTPSLALTLLAEAGMASLHRIGDLAPPLGRPGPGPENARYDLVLPSGAFLRPPPPPPAPPRAQLWAVALSCLLAVGLGLNAWWAWSRH